MYPRGICRPARPTRSRRVPETGPSTEHGYIHSKDDYLKRLRRIEGRRAAAADGRGGEYLQSSLSHHPLQPARLPLDPAQPLEVVVLAVDVAVLVLVARLCSHLVGSLAGRWSLGLTLYPPRVHRKARRTGPRED